MNTLFENNYSIEKRSYKTALNSHKTMCYFFFDGPGKSIKLLTRMWELTVVLYVVIWLLWKLKARCLMHSEIALVSSTKRQTERCKPIFLCHSCSCPEQSVQGANVVACLLLWCVMSSTHPPQTYPFLNQWPRNPTWCHSVTQTSSWMRTLQGDQ